MPTFVRFLKWSINAFYRPIEVAEESTTSGIAVSPVASSSQLVLPVVDQSDANPAQLVNQAHFQQTEEDNLLLPLSVNLSNLNISAGVKRKLSKSSEELVTPRHFPIMVFQATRYRVVIYLLRIPRVRGIQIYVHQNQENSSWLIKDFFLLFI